MYTQPFQNQFTHAMTLTICFFKENCNQSSLKFKVEPLNTCRTIVGIIAVIRIIQVQVNRIGTFYTASSRKCLTKPAVYIQEKKAVECVE